jgi:uncharacterized hydrophobic protein (TIGR00271 family)
MRLRRGRLLPEWVARTRLSDERRQAIAAELFSDGSGELAGYVRRVVVLTALSTVIASLGLIANSAAVVIGAMLVAPLMQPIVALGAGLVLVRPRAEAMSLGLVVLATSEAFVVALLVGWLVPNFRVITLTPEIVSRTAPALLDLLVAVAAGAAGAYLTVRPRAGGALAGVAIAVALVPPLSASGVLVAHGNDRLAAGAFFLFLTNLVGIVLAAIVVFLATGFYESGRLSVGRRAAVTMPILVVALVSYPLVQRSLRTYQVSSYEGQVRAMVVPRLRKAGLGVQNVVVIRRAGLVVASLDVVGPTKPPDSRPLAQQLAERVGHPVRLILRWTAREEQTADSTPSRTLTAG